MNIPRKIRQDLNCNAELSIFSAMAEVEKLPANEKLTEAVILLSKAKDLVSSFIDDKLNNEKRKQYFEEYEWEYNRLKETELTHEEKVKRIGEKIILPAEFIDNVIKNG